MADDVCRPLVVAPYVGEDPFFPLDVGRVCLEIERRRLGIALDRPQRLVQLVGDCRKEQLAHSGGSKAAVLAKMNS